MLESKKIRKTGGVPWDSGKFRRNGMTPSQEYDCIRPAAKRMLAMRGYEYVHPSEWDLAQYAPYLSFVGKRGDYETLCVKVTISALMPGEIRSYEVLCERQIAMLRDLLTIYPGETFLRCEVWIFSRTGELTCIEVTKDGLGELPHGARNIPAPGISKESMMSARSFGCNAEEH